MAIGGINNPVIQDLAHNQLAGPATSQMLGYVDIDEAEELQLKIYSFILASIRGEDGRATLLLKRFLEGPQRVWETNQAKLFAIKTLWNILDIPDGYLQYIQGQLGWTGKYEAIPDALEASVKRRLLDASVAMWKNRGTEDTTVGIIQLTTGAQARIWNWFDKRWIIGETMLAQQHQGNDSWLLDLPNAASGEERYSNLRVVDDGTLDHDLVEALVRLCRATGERIQITYLSFMDLFTIEGDDAQWVRGGDFGLLESDFIRIENGKAIMDDQAGYQFGMSVVNVEGSADWSNYIAYFRVKCYDVVAPETGKIGLGFYFNEGGTEGYMVIVDPFAYGNFGKGEITFNTWDAGGLNEITAVDYEYGNIEQDTYYGVRIQVSAEPNGKGGYWNKVKVYLENDLVLESDDDTYTKGTLTLYRAPDTSLEVDEVEMFQLPADTTLIDINS